MASTPPLSLSNIIDITVSVSPSSPAVNPFNVGLFVGPSTIIPSYGANSRVQYFTSLSAVGTAGFSPSNPEYIAAETYFAQSPAASQFGIGRQDLTALQTITIDGRTVTDGVMEVGESTQLNSATIDFVSGDVGKAVCVIGAGVSGADLVTTIASVTSTTLAVLTVGASTSVDDAVIVVGRGTADGAMNSSSSPTHLSSATATFVSGDIGSTVVVAGAGVAGADLITTIASISSTTVAVLTAACSTTVSGATITIGRTTSDGIMYTTKLLTSATAAFSSGDVGSTVIVEGAGAAGAALVTTIASYINATAVTTTAAASTSVAGAQTSIGFTGSGFAVNDEATVTQSMANYGTIKVLTVGTSGQVLTAQVVSGSQGTGYSIANGLTTAAISPSTGTGLKVNITAVGETLLQAATACRNASSLWYGLTVNAPADADNLAISAWADPLWQTTRYYAYSGDSAIPAGTNDNLALQLQTLQYRVILQYATTQSNLYPNNVYAAVAAMGVEMGLNTGLANSFFTLAHKMLVGIAPEPLTQTQYNNIVSSGTNVYCNMQGYEIEEPGFMSNGAPSYLWLFLAVYVAQLQSEIMTVLQGSPAVPQTNAGEQLLLHAANAAGTYMATIGFLAGSTWEGASINIIGVVVTNGQAIPAGFLNLAQPYSQQAPSDRAAGKAMPIYSFITTAGAVQSLAIGVYTQL